MKVWSAGELQYQSWVQHLCSGFRTAGPESNAKPQVMYSTLYFKTLLMHNATNAFENRIQGKGLGLLLHTPLQRGSESGHRASDMALAQTWHLLRHGTCSLGLLAPLEFSEDSPLAPSSRVHGARVSALTSDISTGTSCSGLHL